MKRYIDLLAKKTKLNYDIKQEKIKLHRGFVKEHKPSLRAIDIFLVIVILMNFSTVFFTNALVVKESVEPPEFYETNPATAEVGNYVPAEQGVSILFSLVYVAIIWGIFIGVYAHLRRSVFTYTQLITLIIIVAYLFFLIGHSFFNDMGYFIGGLIR